MHSKLLAAWCYQSSLQLSVGSEYEGVLYSKEIKPSLIINLTGKASDKAIKVIKVTDMR